MEDNLSLSSGVKDRRTAVGKAGEDAAADHLQQCGYVLVERNWRCRSGELDLIVRDGEAIVFVEVRSRTNPTRYGSALEAITPRKCRQVRDLAAIYLNQRKEHLRSIRFDVVAVTFNGDGTLLEMKHLQGAF